MFYSMFRYLALELLFWFFYWHCKILIITAVLKYNRLQVDIINQLNKFKWICFSKKMLKVFI